MDEKKEMPLGLSFTMAMNEEAMEAFSNMTETQKMKVIEESRQVKSKAEMEQFVNHIGEV